MTPDTDRHLTQPTLQSVESALARHAIDELPRLRLFWAYYRNPLELSATPAHARSRNARAYRLAQEAGLPGRFSPHLGVNPLPDDRHGGPPLGAEERVIENDIAWRINAMVDFMFGRAVRIQSLAADPATRARVEAALDAVWEASGGAGLLQEMALIGHVYGHVDLLVREAEEHERAPQPAPSDEPADPEPADPGPDPVLARIPSARSNADELAALGASASDAVRVQVIEPTRGVPVIDDADWRRVNAYAVCSERALRPGESRRREHAPPPDTTHDFGRGWRWLARLAGGEWAAGLQSRRTGAWRRRAGDDRWGRSERVAVTHVLSARGWRRYERSAGEPAWSLGRLVEEGADRLGLGRVPVVHIQNLAQPMEYTGLGEVEALIPLQDELNARLSDRAARVTMQSFKMYLVKGVEGFDASGVGPGKVWCTDNESASIQAFGGDAASPSEDRHVEDIREALDKMSGVPPLATGVVRAKIGNLTSESALRITLSGLLTKTERKRITYGRGLAEASRLVLTALDTLGILKTEVGDRTVRIVWPDPLPRNERDELAGAIEKVRLGVPTARVLRELGYGEDDDGVR